MVANVHGLAYNISSGRTTMQQGHTATTVIWVNQQWTKVLILLMTKTCLSLMWHLLWLSFAKGHNLRTGSSVRC